MLIDGIIFGWETDILELRLHELDSIVDRFIIIESRDYHGSTNIKPTNLRFNWDIVKPFEHKIEYVLLDKLEPPLRDRNDVWPRENYHRNQIMPAVLEFASPQDILMISDCDEIPRAETIRQNIPRLQNGICGTRQEMFYYGVTNYVSEWHGTVAGTVGHIQALGGPQAARNKRDELPFIDNCGWHFSYFGGVDRIVNKVTNFAHAVDDSAKECLNRGPEELKADIAAGRDLYHRPGEPMGQRREANDSRLPAYFLNNPEKFPQFIA